MNILHRILYVACMAFAGLSTGCQQKMADQPAHRPYEESTVFGHKQSARPLQPGVVHRNQPLPNDPLVTFLTSEGKSVKADPDWVKMVDVSGKLTPPPGAPTSVDNFVSTFPFEMTIDDLKRGQVMFTAVCAECHGAAGHGNGKIPERGFLRPPSYHRDPEGKKKDYARLVVKDPTKPTEPDYYGNPQGTSRGFYRYHRDDKPNTVYLDQVPVGYIFQVITWGYGGMASHETQVPNPADRWRIAAYIRALQLSQGASVADLTPAQQAELNKTGGAK